MWHPLRCCGQQRPRTYIAAGVLDTHHLSVYELSSSLCHLEGATSHLHTSFLDMSVPPAIWKFSGCWPQTGPQETRVGEILEKGGTGPSLGQPRQHRSCQLESEQAHRRTPWRKAKHSHSSNITAITTTTRILCECPLYSWLQRISPATSGSDTKGKLSRAQLSETTWWCCYSLRERIASQSCPDNTWNPSYPRPCAFLKERGLGSCESHQVM